MANGGTIRVFFYLLAPGKRLAFCRNSDAGAWGLPQILILLAGNLCYSLLSAGLPVTSAALRVSVLQSSPLKLRIIKPREHVI